MDYYRSQHFKPKVKTSNQSQSYIYIYIVTPEAPDGLGPTIPPVGRGTTTSTKLGKKKKKHQPAQRSPVISPKQCWQ